jgi:hypothetical protein
MNSKTKKYLRILLINISYNSKLLSKGNNLFITKPQFDPELHQYKRALTKVWGKFTTFIIAFEVFVSETVVDIVV